MYIYSRCYTVFYRRKNVIKQRRQIPKQLFNKWLVWKIYDIGLLSKAMLAMTYHTVKDYIRSILLWADWFCLVESHTCASTLGIKLTIRSYVCINSERNTYDFIIINDYFTLHIILSISWYNGRAFSIASRDNQLF